MPSRAASRATGGAPEWRRGSHCQWLVVLLGTLRAAIERRVSPLSDR